MQRLFLVGPMGAGKTTIGRLLAQELNLVFRDSDKAIEERCGANIPWIFDVEGEEGFRQRETQMLDQLTQENALVLATGGGAIMREENRRILSSRGCVVYLETSLKQQLERTAKDRNRPLLQTEDPETVLKNLMEIRHPLYQQTADIIVKTDNRSPRLVANEILQALASYSANR